MSYFKHESAYVDVGASIGKDTKIWHFCHIMQAQIGEGCILGQNVFIANKVIIGNRVKIQNNVSVYEGVDLEDDVFIGPSVVFTNVINPRSFIERKEEYKYTLVKRGATIGANVTVVCGITIGEYAFIGAGSVLTKNVPAYALMVGNPAKQTGWMSEAGGKLVFGVDNKAICPVNGDAYLLKDGGVSKQNVNSAD